MLLSRLSFFVSRFGGYWFVHRPTFLSIEPANYCMLRCPQCPVGQRGAAIATDHCGAAGAKRDAAVAEGKRTAAGADERRLLSMELCRRVVDEAAEYAHTVIFHFQGEPLLNPALPEMIRYAHERRLFTMLSTNAQTLTPALAEALIRAGLDQIIVSVDGLSQETYAHYRVGGSLERALGGLRALAEVKRRLGYGPEIVMQCLYLRANEHEWTRMREDYKQLGADKLAMKTAQFYDFEDGNVDMPTDSRFSRYVRGKDGKYRLKKKQHNRCYRLWSGCVMTTDGTILPCCFDKDHSYPLGKMSESSLAAIFRSPAAVRFRKTLLRNRRAYGICGNCTE